MKNVKKERTLGIIGYGFLGEAFEYVFAPKCHIMINDIAKEPDQKKFFTKRDLVCHADLIMVGVPTPYSLSEGYVPDIINEVMMDLDNLAFSLNKKPVVLIKSAILPSHVKILKNVCVNLDIAISPEYLSAKNTIGDQLYSNIWIIGGSQDAFNTVKEMVMDHSILNSTWSTPKLSHVSAVDAALIKYMENCFLAMKCTFMSEFYELHEEVKEEDSVPFNDIIKAWQLDPRMGEYPYSIPYQGELGRCSHCICKDTKAIMDEFNNHNVDCSLLKAEEKKSDMLRSNLDDPHYRCRNTHGGVVE